MSDRWDELRGLEFPESYPTPEASERLVDEMLFQRACQVVLWSIPAMSVYAMWPLVRERWERQVVRSSRRPGCRPMRRMQPTSGSAPT